ncbi:MAG TPA: hypothetical protein VK879_03310 [Candidatus Sulfomarinibacteraceae bacterium]|nr:hypothetical protein [Candidatus Sulfomarinibacteraceae bacterium]
MKQPALRPSQRNISALLLVVALFAFEIFNFDTTRFALTDLLGDVAFAGLPWAAILALAFCAIDFAGLAYLFTSDGAQQSLHEAWYLMGAWMLAATMNAVMTWWAVNLTLLSHQFGNEVLSRDQILAVVPPFVAVLVWLTRILFIGAFSVASDHFFDGDAGAQGQAAADPQGALDERTVSYLGAPMRTPTRAAARASAEEGGVTRPRPAPAPRHETPKREPADKRPQRTVHRRPEPSPMQRQPVRASARNARPR